MGASAGSFNGALPGLSLKAWAQVTSAGVLVRGSNVTSITKGGAGIYTITFTAAMGATTYVWRVTPSLRLVGALSVPPHAVANAAPTTAALQLAVGYNGANLDSDFFVEIYE